MFIRLSVVDRTLTYPNGLVRKTLEPENPSEGGARHNALIDSKPDCMPTMDGADISSEHFLDVISRVALVAKIVQRDPYDSMAHQKFGGICRILRKVKEPPGKSQAGSGSAAVYVSVPQTPQRTRLILGLAKPRCHFQHKFPSRDGFRAGTTRIDKRRGQSCAQ